MRVDDIIPQVEKEIEKLRRDEAHELSIHLNNLRKRGMIEREGEGKKITWTPDTCTRELKPMLKLSEVAVSS